MTKALGAGLFMAIFLSAGQPLKAQSQPVREIRVKGNKALEEETIRSYISSREGEEFSADKVTADVHSLFNSGLVQDVRVEKLSHPGPGPGVVLVYSIEEKPMVRKVEHKGIKALTDEEIENIIDINKRSVYDPARVRSIKGEIRDEYSKRGYFMARVEVEVTEAGPNQVDVVFKVDEGRKPTVKSIRFFGNEEIPDWKLRTRMTTKQEGVFTAKKYSREDFLRDQYLLDFFYEDQGYLESAFTSPERLLTKDKKHVLLGLGVEEGPQYRVGKIEVAGDLVVPADELKQGFLLKPGQIFRKSLFMKDQRRLLDLYGELGYALAEVNPELDMDREAHVVDIVWNIRKGRKVYIERIEMSGNLLTRDKVIRRELTIKEGQLYSTRAVRESEARVKQLGYFSEVQFIPRPGSEPDRVNIEVALKERQSGMFSAGAGVSTAEEYFFMLQYQQQNFLGYGVDMSLRASVSDKTQTYNFHYSDSYFLDSKWHFGLNLFSNETYYVEFVDSRQGGGVTLGRRVPHLHNLRFFTSYSYLTTDLQRFSQSSTIYRKQPSDTVISSLAPTLDMNALNDYIDPSDGYRLRSRVEVAGHGLFGGDNDFVKTLLEGWWFQPLFMDTYAGVHMRGKWMSFDQGDDLLITERFFQGGSRSLRGYEVASVSPLFREDSGALTPIGGNKEFYFSAEYLVPLSEQMGMKFALFYEAGNVYNDNEPMDLDNLLTDWGFGLRWRSPMGPLRFELAFPLDPRPGDDPQQFVFSIGTLY